MVFIYCKLSCFTFFSLFLSHIRENKEMNNFISLLDTTLHLNHADQNSEDEEELIPVEEKGRVKKPEIDGGINSRSSSPPTPPSQELARPEPEMHKSVSMPSE